MTSAVIRTSLNDYAALARAWQPGEPLPVVASPELTRYEALLADLGLAVPVIAASRAAGVVLSVGSPLVAAAAGLLASATGRPHHHTDAAGLPVLLDKHAGEPVALVAVADDLTAAAGWLFVGPGVVGMVTTRTEAGLTALVLRTLTVKALPLDGRFTISSAGLRDWDAADAVSVPEAAELRRRFVGTLVLRTHGRECAAILSDGVLCGRSDPAAPLPFVAARAALRTSSCMRGGGCFFEDVTEDHRVPTADLRAAFVLSQSCMTVSAGANEYPVDLGFGLGFLDGVAVAVVGPVGDHADRWRVRELYETRPAGVQTLGELLSELNSLGHSITGDRHEFALLGDPALIVPPSAPVLPRRDAPQYSVPPRIAALHRDVLPRLQRLEWLGSRTNLLPLRNELRELIGDGLRWGSATVDPDGVEQRVADAQRDVVTDFTRTAHEQFWDFKEGVMPGLERVSVEEISCPRCGRATASRIVLRHRIEPDMLLETTRCSICADLTWSTDPSRELATDLPVIALAEGDDRLQITWGIRNDMSEPRTVVAGFGFLLGVKRDLPRPDPVTMRLAPAQATTITLSVQIPETAPVRLEYGGMCVLLSDGHCHAAPVILG